MTPPASVSERESAAFVLTRSDLMRALMGAEQDLCIWAGLLADHDQDRDAAEALRLQSAILKYRMDLTP